MIRRTLKVVITPDVPPVPVFDVGRLDVVCNPDGSLTITADATTVARLGGREQFGSTARVQEVLLDRVARAWYAADCPKEQDSIARVVVDDLGHDQLEAARTDPRGIGDGLGA